LKRRKNLFISKFVQIRLKQTKATPRESGVDELKFPTTGNKPNDTKRQIFKPNLAHNCFIIIFFKKHYLKK